MAEQIVIEFIGNEKDLIAAADAIDKKFDQLQNTVEKSTDTMGKPTDKAKISITDFRSSYMILMDAVRVGQQAWDATGQKFVDYAEQVKNLSRNIGVSAEDASRLIQVADDVRISYESMSIAMKMAQKQGIDVSIEGLAKLADKYKSLAPGIERTQFLVKTFGKSGLEMGKLMEQGGAGITKMSDAIEKGLVLNQKAIDASDKYKMSVDQLSDAWDAFAITLGNEAVPIMTDVINKINDQVAALTILQEKYGKQRYYTKEQTDAAYKQAAAERESATQARLLAGETDGLTDSTGDATDGLTEEERALKAAERAGKEAADALKAVSDENKTMMSMVEDYSKFQKGYDKSHKQGLDAIAKAQDKVNKLIHEGADKGAIKDATDEVQKQKDALAELENGWREATNAMVYNYVQGQLMADGILTDVEAQSLMAYGVAQGIYTQAEADYAMMQIAQGNAIVDGIQASEAYKVELASQQQAVIALTAQYMVLAGVMSRTNAVKAKASPAAATPAPLRDSGGPGQAGGMYMITPRASPEVFIPSTNGNFVPNADKLGAKNITVNIYNPIPTTSAASVNKELKKLSYIGAV